MNSQTKILDISGMHCRSCEILLENQLLKISSIKKVTVNHKQGVAQVEHEGELNIEEVEKVVVNAGYCLGKDEKTFLSKNLKDYRDLGIASFLVAILFLLAKNSGLLNFNFANSNNFYSLPVVFLVGITAGVSTCMALVGGLVLGISAASPQKFKTHLFFNLGRIIAFFVFGAIIGFTGSLFQLSPAVLGFLTMVVGGVMLLLGLQLTGIFPAVRTITLPRLRFLGGKEQSPAILGALTFFLPCGFTQAMQLFAISSGSALTGALTMGVFALGTAPGLLGIGSLASVVKGVFGRLFFKTAGLIVLLLAIFNLSNGYNLTGWNLSGIFSTIFLVPSETITVTNGIQIVNMTQDGSGYHPNNFIIKKGVPVKWVINSLDARNCAASIVMSKYNIRRILRPGENIIEFTPIETGDIKFSCSMGMYWGVFNVQN